MLNPIDIDALVKELKLAQDSVFQIEPFTDRFEGFDLACAYQVAASIHNAKVAGGSKPVGRKIGFTNPDMWSIYGVREPIWAYVYDTTVESLQDAQSVCSLAEFTEPKVEPEIIFHLCEDLPANADLSTVVNSIDWVAHGFEIVQSHFPYWRFRLPDTVADCSLHGKLLLGPSIDLCDLGSDPASVLESMEVELFGNGNLIETGVGSNVLGNPLSAIVHLAGVLGQQPDAEPLKAGELVSTGTITTAQSVQAGESWSSNFRGGEFPGISVNFL